MGDEEKRVSRRWSATPSQPTPVLPAIAGFTACGALAMGFGAGYGSRSFHQSEAYKELLEKFPDRPTAEMEAYARRVGGRALLAGTGLAALMGVGAVATARAYGITTAAQFGEEVRRWFPTTDVLREGVENSPLQPLQRKLSANLQTARDSAGGAYQQSKLGRKLSAQAQASSEKGQAKVEKAMQPWEKELLEKLRKLEAEDAAKAKRPS